MSISCPLSFLNSGRAIAQSVIRWILQRRRGFSDNLFHTGREVQKVALGQFLSQYFGFPTSVSFHFTTFFYLFIADAITILATDSVSNEHAQNFLTFSKAVLIGKDERIPLVNLETRKLYL